MFLYPLFLHFSSPHFPSLPSTSSKVYPETRGNWSPLPSSVSPFLFSVSIFPCHTLLLSVPSLCLSLASCTVYLFEHGAWRVQGDPKPTHGAGVKAQLKAEGHCKLLQKKKENKERKQEKRETFHFVFHPRLTFLHSPVTRAHTHSLMRTYTHMCTWMDYCQNTQGR